MSRQTRAFIVAVVGLAVGAALGWLAGWLIRSDNAPFLVALGAVVGMWGGLAWARIMRLLVLAVGGLLALLLLLVVLTPPRAPIQAPAPPPTAAASPAPRADGLTADQSATLESLRKVDEYPLYTMRYQAGRPRSQQHLPSRPTATDDSLRRQASQRLQRFQPPGEDTSNSSFACSLPSRPTATDDSLRRQASQRLQRFQPPGEDTSNSSFACSLFAALGDAEDRLFGRNFDWRYSPALLLFTDRPAAGGYASISMVDLAYFSFGDQVKDLTTLPLAARRPLLDAPGWPFDGMNAAGVAVGMAAVPQADERHDPGKPSIDSLAVMREILDRAGNVDEAVAILKGYNIAWEDGPPLHYLVADRGGRAALVEFYGGEIAVLLNAGPWHAMTNFTRSAVAGDAAGQCHRYDTLIRRLTDTSGTLSSRGALGLLQAVAQTDSTQWSVVYGMSTGRVEVVMGRSYGQVYTFRLGER